MKRILVIRGGAIGDFVLTLPALKLLRESFPEAHLEILGYKHIIALAENRFYAQAIRSIELAALASFFGKDAELSAGLCNYFGGFDLVVSYLFDPDRIFEHNLQRAGVDNFLACYPTIGHGEHAAKQLARSLEQLGLWSSDPAAHLFPSLGDGEFADRFLDKHSAPVIAIHPGSGSERKNWPILHWLQLSEWLLGAGHAASLLVIGGEADQKELDAICSRPLNGAAVHRVENLSLPLLAAVLQKCPLFIGHDSGISHIAAAVGAPCCLLFGPTDPQIWAPLNENVRVLRAPNENLGVLAPEAVKEAITRILAASHFDSACAVPMN